NRLSIDYPTNGKKHHTQPISFPENTKAFDAYAMLVAVRLVQAPWSSPFELKSIINRSLNALTSSAS
ncbi:hypothetical protein, partial [Brucella pseudogrignonensis]|uniref:hypothetical protein n=1 Tax=Brucella pseudogrignonensis TaxID=419475 RepID=UPI001AEC846C